MWCVHLNLCQRQNYWMKPNNYHLMPGKRFLFFEAGCIHDRLCKNEVMLDFCVLLWSVLQRELIVFVSCCGPCYRENWLFLNFSQGLENRETGKKIMVREKSGKSQGILFWAKSQGKVREFCFKLPIAMKICCYSCRLSRMFVTVFTNMKVHMWIFHCFQVLHQQH